MARTPIKYQNTPPYKPSAPSSDKSSGINYCAVDLPLNGPLTIGHNQHINTSPLKTGPSRSLISYLPNGGNSGSYETKTAMAEIWQPNTKLMRNRLIGDCTCFTLSTNQPHHSIYDGYLTPPLM